MALEFIGASQEQVVAATARLKATKDAAVTAIAEFLAANAAADQILDPYFEQLEDMDDAPTEVRDLLGATAEGCDSADTMAQDLTQAYELNPVYPSQK